MELWKDIKGYEGQYQVSNMGNVRSLDRISPCGRVLRGANRRQHINKRTGYCYVNLCKNAIAKNVLVHRLVAEAFVDNPECKTTVNHINENKQDNRADNLEWMTLNENLHYGSHFENTKKNRIVPNGKSHPNFGRLGAESFANKGRVIAINKKDPSDVRYFDTAATASRIMKLSSGGICEAINGQAQSCGGYYWRRLNV